MRFQMTYQQKSLLWFVLSWAAAALVVVWRLAHGGDLEITYAIGSAALVLVIAATSNYRTSL